MNVLDPVAVRRTWFFLGVIACAELLLLTLQWGAYMHALVLRADRVPAAGWIGALLVAGATIAYSIRALDLGAYMRNVSAFRLLGLIIAIPSSIVEEGVFRATVMTLLMRAGQGDVVQVLGSAVTFGFVHAVWGIRGDRRALAGAVISMTVLGALLGIVYLLSGRALLPCVIAHFLINIVLEPWLGYRYALRAQGVRVSRSIAA